LKFRIVYKEETKLKTDDRLKMILTEMMERSVVRKIYYIYYKFGNKSLLDKAKKDIYNDFISRNERVYALAIENHSNKNGIKQLKNYTNKKGKITLYIAPLAPPPPPPPFCAAVLVNPPPPPPPAP
jgi:hypothetical protein